MEKLAEKIGLSCTSTPIAQNPFNPDWKDAYHFEVILRLRRFHADDDKHLITYYSMGRAHARKGFGGMTIAPTPNAAEVLDCLLLDADAANYGSFEEWADSVCFDPDSRKAEKLYHRCLKVAEEVKEFLGEHWEDALEAERL